jgi:hypothetical protein
LAFWTPFLAISTGVPPTVYTSTFGSGKIGKHKGNHHPEFSWKELDAESCAHNAITTNAEFPEGWTWSWA